MQRLKTKVDNELKSFYTQCVTISPTEFKEISSEVFPELAEEIADIRKRLEAGPCEQESLRLCNRLLEAGKMLIRRVCLFKAAKAKGFDDAPAVLTDNDSQLE